ncbi:MAG: hypothetical protein V7L11_09815 [Nostoc sp.]|uniref:hypothetical protein n=1 Tax=Nostoc sp. TaxID=1180 RepID=UPI002FF6C55C
MQSIPYQYRLLILFLLMGLVVAVDYWRNPTKPTKLREYSFLIMSGLIGAGFGIVTALPAAMRYILKAETYERKGQEEKLYCIA